MIRTLADDLLASDGNGGRQSAADYLARVFSFIALGLAIATASALLAGEVRAADRGPAGLTDAGWALVLAPLLVPMLFEIVARVAPRLPAAAIVALFVVQAAITGVALETAFARLGLTIVVIALAAAMGGYGFLALVQFSLPRSVTRTGLFLTPLLAGSVLAAALTLWFGMGPVGSDLAEAILLIIALIVTGNFRRLLAFYERSRPTETLGDVAGEAAATLALDPLQLLPAAEEPAPPGP
ncbi:Bax inhibitor-1 family protein [Sphingomonas hylomeconis]|uniref:Bax inhibitor-1 family protein n=1 Tax=Sphingomonas hylomeconis TaxID=1395958 RepID=A0ABV7SVE9_9SPHN|nr:Bax inhibitor-1 family protein [Sphingomonas hylomeconis]